MGRGKSLKPGIRIKTKVYKKNEKRHKAKELAGTMVAEEDGERDRNNSQTA